MKKKKKCKRIQKKRKIKTKERGVCFLSAQEGMEQESVAERDRARTERKTVDNFLI